MNEVPRGKNRSILADLKTFWRIWKAIMLQEGHMKIVDYLERSRGASFLDKKSGMDRGERFSPYKKFACILSSCGLAIEKAKNHECGGLKISDYLKNPVQVRHSGRVLDRPDFRNTEASYRAASVNSMELSERAGSSKNGTLETDILKKPDDINDRKGIDKSIKAASAKYGLPVFLIKAVVKAESDFQVRAVSSAGAQGLMQLMPETAEELGVEDPFDIDQNIDGGTRYLKKMLDLFGEDVELALAAYNAGPGTVIRCNGNVPYRETMHYVERVLEYSRQLA